MKVVLFCGGFGLRMRSHPDDVPKPMVRIGYRPILWNIMKYYAHFGHRDFILCLGWKADVIKRYFLDYDECVSNDFVLNGGGGDVQLLNRDIEDWNITFVDTGTSANIGQRLAAVAPLLAGEEAFLANYTDGLTDFHLPDMIDAFHRTNATATFLSVRPRHSFHAVTPGADGRVQSIVPIDRAGLWMNGGFFVFRHSIFDAMKEGEELVEEPFQRLMAEGRLFTHEYEGFWSCMDTYKEKQTLDDMIHQGRAVWEVWKPRKPANGASAAPAAEPRVETPAMRVDAPAC